MITTILFFVALEAGFSQESSGDARTWIEKLWSDRIEERDQASHEIRKLGKAAIPELEKVAAEKDAEVATRARTLIRLIRLNELFGIHLKDVSDLSVVTLVEWMEKKTGRRFVYSEELGLRNIKVRFPEGLLETDDPYSVGVDLLRLANIGVAAVDSAPGVLELFPAAVGSKKGLKLCKTVDELPKANEFCMLSLHPLRVSARSVQAALIGVVSFPQNCLGIEDSGTVLLADYASVLRKCAEIVKTLDVSRSFRVSVVLMEGRAGGEEAVPDAYRNLRLAEATGLSRFTVLGTASSKLGRVVMNPPGGAAPGGRSALRFGGPPAYLVEFDGAVRTAGAPTLDRFTVRLDQEHAIRLFEATLPLKDENWMVAGVVPVAEGASLVILLRAVPD